MKNLITLSENYAQQVIDYMLTRNPQEMAFIRSEYNNDKDFMTYVSNQYDQSETQRIKNHSKNFYPSIIKEIK